jgi:Mg2+ and Co2+ transporter CorA
MRLGSSRGGGRIIGVKQRPVALPSRRRPSFGLCPVERRNRRVSTLRSSRDDAGEKVGRPQGDEMKRSSGAMQPLLRQLREAVLSSLDVPDAQMSGDWSDVADAALDGGSSSGPGPHQTKVITTSLWDTLNSQANPSASSGKATFEVLRIDEKGNTRISHVRRRDLIRQYKLPPRDLRTMDGSIASSTKSNIGINCKDDCILINIGGVRAFLTVDRVLLFEPYSKASKKFVEILCTKLNFSNSSGERGGGRIGIPASTIDEERDRLMLAGQDGAYYSSVEGSGDSQYLQYSFPFELEVVEAALNVATLKLEAELVAASHRVGMVLQKLPRYITPANLEELRRVKDVLVALEAKADALEEVIEGLLEDDEKIAELNLSTRPIREEKRKQRELNKRQREARMEGGEARAGNTGDGKFEGSEYYPLSSVDRQDLSLEEKSQRDRMDAQFLATQELDIEQEMQENEDEERELEETEDVLEYYAQRAQMTSSEADRLLQGARDLEESINVSLSLRRYDVNRIELMLSIASFAAAVGACISGIFGMNLRSTLENSVIGFWGTAGMILVGCTWIFWIIYRYTKRKRIL